jgi:hypothetical protein
MTEHKKNPTLKALAAMDSDKWYDVRTTNGASGTMITARKKGCPGQRFFLAWDKAQLVKDVHYLMQISQEGKV